MGMTIDNAIGLLERGSQYNFYDSAEDFCMAYDMAIETMRKYQKIEELIEYHMLRTLPKKNMSRFQKDILEVVDNGNDD